MKKTLQQRLDEKLKRLKGKDIECYVVPMEVIKGEQEFLCYKLGHKKVTIGGMVDINSNKAIGICFIPICPEIPEKEEALRTMLLFDGPTAKETIKLLRGHLDNIEKDLDNSKL